MNQDCVMILDFLLIYQSYVTSPSWLDRRRSQFVLSELFLVKFNLLNIIPSF